MTTVATDKSLIAHLLRRAGFGATFQEIEQYAEMGYEETVDHLLHPERTPDIEEDLLERYYIDWKESRNIEGALVETVYRFNARAGVRPLQEKIALFWHHVFATGLAKVLHEKTILNQIDLFREHGLGNYRDLLVLLAKDPAMIFWLDNNVNHKEAINENWGRELLELFSMGIGMDSKDNYTEEDVQEVARAFTGWTMDDDNTASIPFGKMPWLFKFDSGDHDGGEKTVLGETGNFTGEDVIDIIAKQPSTARFICRHLYSFFVADEVQVPSWRDTAPIDPDAIKAMEDVYFESNYNIRAILKVVFNSDFFKNSKFQKVKNPAEVVCGTMHIVGSNKFPIQGIFEEALECRYMNQDLLNPPSVEGWHTGKEWIDSGSLVERINYVSDELSDTSKPGVRAMVDNLMSRSSAFTPEALIDGCLELLGYVELKDETMSDLVESVGRAGEIRTDNPEDLMFAEQLMLRTLKMIGATREYQFG